MLNFIKIKKTRWLSYFQKTKKKSVINLVVNSFALIIMKKMWIKYFIQCLSVYDSIHENEMTLMTSKKKIFLSIVCLISEIGHGQIIYYILYVKIKFFYYFALNKNNSNIYIYSYTLYKCAQVRSCFINKRI